jgi:hypothetical protein
MSDEHHSTYTMSLEHRINMIDKDMHTNKLQLPFRKPISNELRG